MNRSERRSETLRHLRRLACSPVVAGLMSIVIGGCAINPVSGRPEVALISSGQEKQLGREEAKKVEQQMGLVEDPMLTGYLDTLGQRLAEQSPRRDVIYRFHIVEMQEPNAFALPGGDIYVSRGLLPLVNSEDELAGVVGHEIGHVAARHSVQRISKQAPFAVVFGIVSGITGLVSPLVGSIVGGVGDLAQGLVFAPYSRSQENEADHVGQEISARAGWDPAALSTFLSTLEREVALMSKGPRKPSFFDSHPATPDRVARTAAHAKELQRTAREPISVSREAFLSRLNGLAVGAPAANGVFDGQHFLHPDLDFFVRFPEKWELKNSPEVVAGVAPDGEALAALKAVGQGTDPLDGAHALEKAGGSPIVQNTQRITIGNLQAARTQLEAENNLVVDLTWIAHAGRIYLLVGIAPKKRFDALRPTFDMVVLSFRPLAPAERAGIREKRLRLVKAHAGETLDALVARTNSSWSKDEVAVANNLPAGEQLKDGRLLKIAVSEPYVSKGR